MPLITDRAKGGMAMPGLQLLLQGVGAVLPDTDDRPANALRIGYGKETRSLAGGMEFDPLLQVDGPAQIVLGLLLLLAGLGLVGPLEVNEIADRARLVDIPRSVHRRMSPFCGHGLKPFRGFGRVKQAPSWGR